MTDLRHVGQLLHRAAVDERLGTTALAGWLRARIRAAVEEGGDEERTRRLESDADAVQVPTIHRSKGLEFPIVYCPFLWDTIWRDDKVADPVVFHDDDGARKVDVALEGSAYAAHAARAPAAAGQRPDRNGGCWPPPTTSSSSGATPQRAGLTASGAHRPTHIRPACATASKSSSARTLPRQATPSSRAAGGHL